MRILRSRAFWLAVVAAQGQLSQNGTGGGRASAMRRYGGSEGLGIGIEVVDWLLVII
jgi:hypothetical protein